MTKAEEKRAAIVAQQAAREKAERDARGEAPTAAPGAKKARFSYGTGRGPGRPSRRREEP